MLGCVSTRSIWSLSHSHGKENDDHHYHNPCSTIGPPPAVTVTSELLSGLSGSGGGIIGSVARRSLLETIHVAAVTSLLRRDISDINDARRSWVR
jgi:hypothetical protein